MRKYNYNYNIVHSKDRSGKDITVAYSSFAGKPVRGIAKCNPEDTPDAAKGVMLAKARCGLKIAKKRRKYAEGKYAEAKAAMIKAIGYFNEMESYVKDSIEAQLDAEDYLKEVLEEL